MQENSDKDYQEGYSEIQEYLSHQDSWVESQLGENLTYALKEELSCE